MSGVVEMKSMRPLADTDRQYDNLAYVEDDQNHKVGPREYEHLNSCPDIS